MLSRRAWFLRELPHPRAAPPAVKHVRRRIRREHATARWLERVRLGRAPRTDRLERWFVLVAVAVIAAAIAAAASR